MIPWARKHLGLLSLAVAGLMFWGWWFGTGQAARTARGGETEKVSIEVNLYSRRLIVYQEGKVVATYPVAIGKKETPTPVGEWRVTRKALHWGGGFGSRWIGLDVPWGIYGIHGTNKPWLIGRAVSHGCIRMRNQDVEKLYELVSPGTEVKVVGYLPSPKNPPLLRRGSASPEVVGLQFLLRNAGIYSGRADGRFGEATEEAVKKIEEYYNLPIDGTADRQVWSVLYTHHSQPGSALPLSEKQEEGSSEAPSFDGQKLE